MTDSTPRLQDEAGDRAGCVAQHLLDCLNAGRLSQPVAAGPSECDLGCRRSINDSLPTIAPSGRRSTILQQQMLFGRTTSQFVRVIVSCQAASRAT